MLTVKYCIFLFLKCIIVACLTFLQIFCINLAWMYNLQFFDSQILIIKLKPWLMLLLFMLILAVFS